MSVLAIGTAWLRIDLLPAAAQPKLRETFRKAVSSAVASSAVAYISTFLGASEANSTWQEFGHFINGTGSANSGTLLSHVIQTVVKASPNTKTVDNTYTFSDA